MVSDIRKKPWHIAIDAFFLSYLVIGFDPVYAKKAVVST